LPIIAGKRILPIYPIAAIAGLWVLWNIAPVAGEMAVWAAQGMWGAITWVASEFMELRLWIPFALLAILAITGIVSYGIHAFSRSEMYALWKMGVRAKVDKICPIVPVK
jgi:hypothetical protein